MAITPALAAGLTDQQAITLARVVGEVDLYLASNWAAGQSLTIRTALIADLLPVGEKLMNAFLAAYRAVGWSIVVYENAQQGSWLSFSQTP
jgi:hypothetical protein